MNNIASNPEKVKIKLLCASCAKVLEVHLSVSGPHLKAECTQCGRFVKFISHKEIDRLKKVESFQKEAATDGIRIINPPKERSFRKDDKTLYKSILPPLKRR